MSKSPQISRNLNDYDNKFKPSLGEDSTKKMSFIYGSGIVSII